MRARGLLIVFVALLLPTLAHAGDKKVAAAHFQKGRALYDAQRYDAALVEFNAGYEAFPLPGFLVNIAQCHRKLEHLEEARDAYQRFLDARTGDLVLRGEVEEALAEVRGELARRAEAEAQRQRAAEEARQTLLRSIAVEQRKQDAEQRADLKVRASAVETSPAMVEKRASKDAPKKSRRWVWAIVGVVAAGAVAAGVTVAVIQTQPETPAPGSLGLLDGRR